MLKTDCFGEPESHSYPLGGIGHFDTLMWGQGAEASRTRTLADIQARTESILVTDSGILPMDNIRIIPEMTIDSRVSSGNESNQLSLLSPEVQLALTLMGGDMRDRFTNIAAHFAQDPKDEEGEEGV